MTKYFKLKLAISDEDAQWTEDYEVSLSELIDAYGRDLVNNWNCSLGANELPRTYMYGECNMTVEK